MGVVTRGFRVGIPPTNVAVIASSVDVLLGGANIGFVSQIQSQQTRNVERVRHLNTSDAGRIVEQVPLPEDATVNATGFALYNKAANQRLTLLNRMSGNAFQANSPIGDPNMDGDSAAAFVSLNQQHIPIDMVRTWKHPMQEEPGSTSGDEAAQRVIFYDCYITNYSTPINIGTATVAETVTLQVGYVAAPPASS